MEQIVAPLTPYPSGQKRRGCGASLFDAFFFQIREDGADGRQFFCFLVRDLGFERIFERHHQFNRIERVGSEVFDERSFGFDLVGR